MSTDLYHSPLPSRHAVRSLVEDLVGRNVDLRDVGPMSNASTNLVAAYVTDSTAVSAVAVLDLEGAARIGAALGMLPKAGVDEAIEARALPDLMRSNAYEVMNVLSAVFNVEGAPHVRLFQLYGPDGSVPGDLIALSQIVGSRMDVILDIAGYGEARLSIITR